MKKRLALLLIFCLVCSLCTACAGRRVLSAEELSANIAVDPPTDRTDVVAILEAWQMPSFYSSVFTPYLAAYEGRMQQHSITPLMLAREAANAFVQNEYASLNLTDRQAVTSALLRCYEAAAERLCPPLTNVQALRDAIQTDMSHDYAAMYLVAWGYPSFLTQKMMAVETVFDGYFFEDVPAPAEMARRVAEQLIELLDAEGGDTLSLTERSLVTDIYLNAYVGILGDPYSIYRTAEESDVYEDDRRGEYVGIGVTIRREEQTDEMCIIALNPTGPAKEVGMEVGDIIYAVNGQLVSELGYNAAVSAVRGEVGSQVTVTVLRDGVPLEFTITRRALVDITVTWSISEDNIGYIKITEFKSNTYTQFCEAVDALEAAGVRGVIYDLRDNPGGALTAVTNSLSYLVPVGTRVASFSTYMDPIDSQHEHTFRVPSVVLCNENTASAGELFTAAMRDYSTDSFDVQDAVIVGTQTYGKGIMQSTFSLYDSSSITVTVAKYNPPSGVNYHGEGIIPDEIVPPSEEGDAQLDRAYDILNGK